VFAHGLAVDVSDSGSNAFDTIITNMMTFGIESNKGVIKTKYLNHNLSWCVKPLSGLVRKVKRGPSLATNERGKGVRYLTSGNIQDNKVDMISEVKHLDGFDAMDQCRICPEDILFNCVNSMARVGKVAYVTSDSLDSETIVGFNNYSLEVDKEVILPKFLYYFMVDKRFLHRVRALVKPAINQASFASKELNHMLIAYPSINEQKKIVGLLDEASSLLDHEKIQIEKIAAVRTNLSQSLGI
jgi:type I restriction enzyme S subunit